MRGYIILLQVFVAASIFFVWVVRYQNIIAEFKNTDCPIGCGILSESSR